jgi:hypothetical protein
MARAKPNLDWMKTVLGNLEDRPAVDAPDTDKPADVPPLHPPSDDQGEPTDPASGFQKARSG